ncbi:PilC/PilY family type IV pilus protein [Hydrogenophaga sp. PAMC20947]|uniref:pilus assembly protein n=1 Tax=Hydrogenophaga sp. PAMC20947 TaxID=2565558 RepID=UPI0014459E18|nr:PilC/PilY family type IV pilus protein [Hydrogenophaga sp. PAMC20947]
MNRFKRHHLAAAAILLMATSSAHAGQMTFSQTPPGAGAREPAPNIIVSVDDSGSMGWDIPTRMTSLKAAMINTFGNPTAGTKGIIVDDRIRLGWQTMWDNGRYSRPSDQRNDQSTLSAGAINSVKVFSGTHRTNFNNFITSLTPSNGTPSHKMLANVYGYMSTPTGVNSLFAKEPTVTASPYLSCRRSYHILMTDGAWNNTGSASPNAGNYDGTTRTLPDGTTYSTTDPQTGLYRDSFGGSKGTLADWAMRNWATDFQSSLANDVRAIKDVTTAQTVGALSVSTYWNPKNNPMTWQGVTQYTIGFGDDATSWGATPVWDATTDDNYGGDYANLFNGTVSWLDVMSGSDTRRASDLWHAALNGRGKYYPARTPSDLQAAFQDILSNILAQTAKPLVSIATSSTRLTTGAFAYIAKFNSENWTGDLSAYAIASKTGLPSTSATWTASTLMNSTDLSVFNPSTRVVLTHNGTVGKGFKWANLDATQKSVLRNGTSDTTTVGEARVDFLRGDRTKEQRETGGYLRNRDSRLGDIVNSNIWYTGKPLRMDTDYTGHASFRSSNSGRTPVLYVGANDGMLHGFNASTGKEVLAYVPLGAYANLRNFTQTDYSHSYFVDGHPFTGDAYNGSSWKTYLVGALGAGGKGYFILDVTSPAFTDPGTGDSSVVILDNTATTHADIGHIFAAPTLDNGTQSISQQIVKLNNGRWAVLMGNGYNSTNERPVLLIQYLDGAKELKPIVANSSTGQTNGLGAPRAVDVDGNGTMDVVYAGDLKGNLWKFNLIKTSDTNWGVSAWSGDSVCSNSTSCQPLYVAKTSGGATQPITAAPVVLNHPYGGKQVVFGTGKDLIASDRDASSPQVQTTYSVWDKTTYALSGTSVLSSEGSGASISTGRSALVAQTVTSTDSSGYVSTSSNTVAYSLTDSSAKRGWYLDLPISGERVLSNPLYLGESTVLVGSVVPKEAIEGETCDLSSAVDKGYITALNAISGKAGSTPLFGEAAPTATRTAFGTGEFASLTDIKNGRQRAISSDANCTGSDCSTSSNSGTGTGTGGAYCEAGTGCDGPTCPAGENCGGTCSGADCVCNSKLCQCVGADCACTGSSCISSTCGTVIPGAIADLCIPGLFGARTDWRELR